MFAYVNGLITPEEEAKVSINDRGWLYGDAVFETVRTYGGRVFKLMEHYERLQRSADLAGIDVPLTGADVEKALTELLTREFAPKSLDRSQAFPTRDQRAGTGYMKDVMARITVSRGVGGAGIYPVRPVKPTVVIQLRAIPDYPGETFSVGWKLIVARTRRNSPSAINPGIKSTNFLNNVLAKREAVEAGVNEALMLNQQGFIAESTTSNFFMVKAGQLRTPPASDGILPGITRETIMNLAVEAGVPVWERSVEVDAAKGADEAFLTLTSAGVIPVVSIDGCAVGDGRPGRVTHQLLRLYANHVDKFKKGGI